MSVSKRRCPENHYLYAMQTPLLYMRFENSVMIGGVSYGYTYTTEAGKRKQIPDYPFQKRDIQDVTELLCTRTNFWVTDGADVSTDTETIFSARSGFTGGRTGTLYQFCRRENQKHENHTGMGYVSGYCVV